MTNAKGAEAPLKGTITSWLPDDSIGRIRLASGEEIRFGHSACVDLTPAVGAEVWVVELAAHPLGGRKAKVINGTGAPSSDRGTAARAAQEHRAQIRPAIEAEIAAMTKERDAALAARPGPWEIATALGNTGLPSIVALRERMPRDEIAAFVSSIPALDAAGTPANDLRLFDLEWADTWSKLAIWTDPAFVPFAEEGGNHLGVFAHPAAVEAGVPAAVVFRFHEHDPVFAWVAESADHFVRMIDAAARGDDVEALRGERHPVVLSLLEATQREEAFEDLERKDVHALFWSGSRVTETAAASRLALRYRDRGWTFPLASVEVQLALSTWQDRIDAAWSKLK